MRKVQVNWIKKSNGEHFIFDKLNYSIIKDCGVYLIWNSKAIIKVGQSTYIGNRFTSHNNDRDIMRYNSLADPLLTTWANLPESSLDGVEAYLGERYRPLVSERFPDAQLIAVNLP